jgi:hypothetical protein
VKWEEFLDRFAAMPFFHSSMLAIFNEDRRLIWVQLSRWVMAGKIARIRREWYMIEKPWRAKEVPVPYIATQIVQPSYLSLDWALQYHGLIPEGVPNPTCVTTDRPQRLQALDRLFLYHHIQPALLTGFTQVSIDGQNVPVALAEKALFDKIYIHIQRNKFSLEWLRELRLQNLELLELERFVSFADKTVKWGLEAAIRVTTEYIRKERR